MGVWTFGFDERAAAAIAGDVRAIEEAGYKVTAADLTMIPTTSVELTEESQAKTVLRLADALEDHDDVEAVYANFDIPDAVLEAVTA